MTFWNERFPRLAGPVVILICATAACYGFIATNYGKSARFWRGSAFAVVRVVRWRVVRVTNNLGGSWECHRERVRVLAVLATERMVKINTSLFVSMDSPVVAPLVGPIRLGGTFLVYMTLGHTGRWGLGGGTGVPFMPKGLESVAVTGLSDPLVKKIQAKIEKLIVLAHARK